MKMRVVVVGGGLGGIASALMLAKTGHHVTLIEKSDRLGGKMSEVKDGGFRFDTGPSLLTMPFVLEELFRRLGTTLEEQLVLEPVDPVCRYFYPAGTVVDGVSSPERFQRELAKLSERDASRLPEYLAYAKRIYDLTTPVFLERSLHDLSQLLSKDAWRALFSLRSLDTLRTVHQANSSFFESKEVVQLFDRYATYNGSSPFEAPATLNTIVHVEYGLGGFYIKGGMYRLVDCLSALLAEAGVTVLTGEPVEKLLHQSGRIHNVRIAGGRELEADAVVCNSDVAYSYRELIDGFPKKQKRLDRAEPSLSGLVFLWGVRGERPALAHHNILFSPSYDDEFRQLFTERQAPDDPTVYISVTSKSDPSHAPAGCENWFVLVNMPYVEDMGSEERWRAGVRAAVLKRCREAGLGDVEADLVVEHSITPQELLRRTNTNRGSIYGTSSNSRLAAFLRQPNRASELKGLYFAGGSAHPGGGIPLVLLSGMIAADLLCRDYD